MKLVTAGSAIVRARTVPISNIRSVLGESLRGKKIGRSNLSSSRPMPANPVRASANVRATATNASHQKNRALNIRRMVRASPEGVKSAVTCVGPATENRRAEWRLCELATPDPIRRGTHKREV